ncbi:acyl-CoA dehydrogenase family protein [Desulfamplus magnetovallimortis]|nr:acyl-CoA dehydrogenase family protein [Desulfamplus magnetovallimortis]
MELSAQHKEAQKIFREFVKQNITPTAAECDRVQETPMDLIKTIADEGYLGALVPEQYGGKGMDPLSWGLLCEEVGHESASLLSLLTVHSMVIQAIVKWGTEGQKNKWLPRLATGETIGGFGLTEIKTGSDARNAKTVATLKEDYTSDEKTSSKDEGTAQFYVLNGRKRWISFGQVASLFIILGQLDEKPTAFLVERESEGFSTEAISGMMGFKSAMLAELRMDDCIIPGENMVGRPGFGFSHVIGAALDQGRFCIAWGSLGIAQGCVDACLSYTNEREQFGVSIKEHQLIQEMIADMITQTSAARMLCLNAASLKAKGDPSLIMETSMAKYFASRAAVKIAGDAVQIHGANGCSDQYPVERYFRDAKIMEIIEGSNQMQQIIISRYGYQKYQMSKMQEGKK